MPSYVEKPRDEKPKQKKPDKYPPREGFVAVSNSGGNGGYLCPGARPCKCGGEPKFQQVTTDKEQVAQVFVGICKKCGRRTVAEGPLETVLAEWNKRRFTRDSELVSGKLVNPSEDGLRMLCSTVVSESILEAAELVKQMHELKRMIADPLVSDYRREILNQELSQVKGNLQSYQYFFETSPLMYDREADSALSDVRRLLHPDLTMEERLKIPLKLVSM